MPWNSTFNADLNAIEMEMTGQLSPVELEDGFRQALELSRNHKVLRFIADCRQLEGGHSVTNLYRLADEIIAANVGTGFQEAVILPEAALSAELAAFWETTCLNRGLNVRAFTDRASAIKWLKPIPSKD